MVTTRHEAAVGEEAGAGGVTAWLMLGMLAASQFLGMSPWFAASAIGPQLAAEWGLGQQQVGWLTTAVQLGFVAGTLAAAVLNAADVIPARWYFAGSALAAALANGLLLVAVSFESALVLRFLTGALLAGVYPPAMKMAATWFRSGRGFAIGIIVGALTLGKATPYLIRALGGVDAAAVVLATSAGCLLSALLIAAAYRDGPYPFSRKAFRWSLTWTVLSDGRTRSVIAGYCGHMLELYAVWVWVPAFLLASAGGAQSQSAIDLAAFLAIGSGAAGCVLGGRIADRIGRARWTIFSMAGSGACCLGAALVFGGAWFWVVLFVSIWGFFVVADSAQFSALVTEVAPDHGVGTALTIQTSIGFALTGLTIQLVPFMAAAAGWRWAFPILAVGPFLGIAAMRRLTRAA